MSALFHGGAIAAIVLFTLYPAMAYVVNLLFPDRKEHRMREYRLFAGKLVLAEYQMLQIINQAREKKGLSPIPYQPVLDQFKGVSAWAGLRIKCEETIRYALGRLVKVKP